MQNFDLWHLEPQVTCWFANPETCICVQLKSWGLTSAILTSETSLTQNHSCQTWNAGFPSVVTGTTRWVKKGCHPNHGYNFVNSWSILKILSLLQRALNFQQNPYVDNKGIHSPAGKQWQSTIKLKHIYCLVNSNIWHSSAGSSSYDNWLHETWFQ